jgi:hypothetical protein
MQEVSCPSLGYRRGIVKRLGQVLRFFTRSRLRFLGSWLCERFGWRSSLWVVLVPVIHSAEENHRLLNELILAAQAAHTPRQDKGKEPHQ